MSQLTEKLICERIHERSKQKKLTITGADPAKPATPGKGGVSRRRKEIAIDGSQKILWESFAQSDTASTTYWCRSMETYGVIHDNARGAWDMDNFTELYSMRALHWPTEGVTEKNKGKKSVASEPNVTRQYDNNEWRRVRNSVHRNSVS